MISFDEFLKQDDEEKYNNMQHDLLEIERLTKRLEEAQLAFLQVDKERQRLNNIINELEDSIVGKINVLYQVRGQSNAIQELSILLRQLRELKGEDKE